MNDQAVIRQVIELLTALLDDNDGQPFGEALRAWYEKYKRPKLKDSSLYNMERYVRIIEASELGRKRLTQVSGEELQDFIIGTFTGGVVRKQVRIMLNDFFEKKVKLRKLLYNPLVSVELPKHKTKHYRPLEFEEQNKIIYYHEHPQEYGNSSPHLSEYCAVFRFMCCTGVRIGEFLALDFKSDVDTAERVIKVNKNKDSRTGKIITTKTETSERSVPFLPELLPTIAALENRKFTYESVKQHFDRTYKRLGIDGANLHSFRHTFISMCNAAKMSPKLIQTIAGHADIVTTMNVYTHILRRGGSPLYEYVKKLKEGLE